MTRTLTTFAAAAVLAVSAGVASAATTEKTATQSPAYTLNNTMISGYSIKAPAKQTVIPRSRQMGSSCGMAASATDPTHGLLSTSFLRQRP